MNVWKSFSQIQIMYSGPPRNLKSITKTLESLTELSSGKVRDFVVYGFFLFGENEKFG